MTIPAIYINGVVEKEMSLAEYLKSDEYKNEEIIYYTDPIKFLDDLKKYKN